jgi:uncharacterized protein YfaA (DUF2138 family)
MTKAQLVDAPRPYSGIKQAKIATASAHAVAASSAMVQISLIPEGRASRKIFAQTAKKYRKALDFPQNPISGNRLSRRHNRHYVTCF